MKMHKVSAVIFDMDGVIIDNNAFHNKAWETFLKEYSVAITPAEFERYVSGRSNSDIFSHFEQVLPGVNRETFADEKEKIYRKLYRPHIKAMKGLIPFLEDLKSHGIRRAIATSASSANIEFMLAHVPVRGYWDAIVNAAQVPRGKPHPDIYLEAAARLSVPNRNCLVFEDSVAGINAARAAGMKVVGISSSASAAAPAGTVDSIPDFEKIKAADVFKWLYTEQQ